MPVVPETEAAVTMKGALTTAVSRCPHSGHTANPSYVGALTLNTRPILAFGEEHLRMHIV
jgi:hypothetical protein